MSEKHTILKGTFILTATGFLSRFIGFFYRMFLSHTFGEESVGLYQLIFPHLRTLLFAHHSRNRSCSFPVRRKKSSSFQTQRSKTTFCMSGFSFPLRSLRSPQLYYRQMPLLFPSISLAIYAVNHYSLRSLIRFLSHLSTVVSADTISGESRQKFRHSHNLSNKLHESSVYMSYI